MKKKSNSKKKKDFYVGENYCLKNKHNRCKIKELICNLQTKKKKKKLNPKNNNKEDKFSK